MQLNSKSSIPLTWAAGIVVFVAQGIITYTASSYGTKTAIQELKTEMLLEVNNLKNEDKRLWDNVGSLKSEQERQENLMVQFGEMLIPERTEFKRRR